jgi:hypothetical protein
MPSHDSFFKRLFRAFFPDLLRLVLPATARRLDFRHLTFLDKELLVGAGKLEADLLARLSLRSGGSQLLLHVEIESRARRRIVERLRQYRRRIEATYNLDVVSIVVTLRGGEPGVHVRALPGVTAGPGLGSRYVAFGLAGCDAATYLRRPEPLAWALAALMDPGELGRTGLKMTCLQRIAEAGLPAEGRDLLVDCVATYLKLTPDEISEYATLDSDGKNREAQTMEMSWGDRLRQEGQRLGRKEGRREGLEQGARRVLLRLLGQRFGQLPDSVRRRVAEIDSVERLTRLAERVLTARSLEDVGLAPRSDS